LLATDDGIDMEASAFFFSRLARLNPVADRVDPSNEASIYQVNGLLTHRVNGPALNGLVARLSFYRRALKVLFPAPQMG